MTGAGSQVLGRGSAWPLRIGCFVVAATPGRWKGQRHQERLLEARRAWRPGRKAPVSEDSKQEGEEESASRGGWDLPSPLRLHGPGVSPLPSRCSKSTDPFQWPLKLSDHSSLTLPAPLEEFTEIRKRLTADPMQLYCALRLT